MRDESILGLSTYEHDKCFLQQIKYITYFYIFNVFLDVILWVWGAHLLKTGDLICARFSFILVNNESGTIYMFFHSGMIMFYSYFMYLIFYRLPRNYNLVAFQKFGTRKLETN
jgi:hypothetical protein